MAIVEEVLEDENGGNLHGCFSRNYKGWLEKEFLNWNGKNMSTQQFPIPSMLFDAHVPSPQTHLALCNCQKDQWSLGHPPSSPPVTGIQAE
ncbi:hypothetical protein CEXT_71241 [Caerostris extrusa]|uniref:Ycf15 n=1 Tax=Caerostris extrusa TaxID=172846 RepID=A0AAV4U562_CAEEX|nr:hypothetical protein CEXT_71241 [Caerostris extrusa]